MLAPDWSRANQWRHIISGEGNRWPVGKRGWRAHGNRKSRDLRWETADECEKRIVGSRGRKTAEKTRAQSPAAGVTHIWSIYGFDMAQVPVGQRGKYKRGSAVSQKMEASDWSRAITWPEDDVMSFPVEETADQLEKKDRGLIQPEVTWFEMGNRWRVWKKDRGLKVGENRGENAGSKSGGGGDPYMVHIWVWYGTSPSGAAGQI